MKIATLASLIFDQSPIAATITAIADNVYTTPEALRKKLGQFVRAGYLEATLKGSVVLSASDTCDLRVRLTDGVEDYATVALDINASDRIDFSIENVNLRRISGNTPVYLALDVTAGASAATALLYGQLEIEFPVVVANG